MHPAHFPLSLLLNTQTAPLPAHKPPDEGYLTDDVAKQGYQLLHLVHFEFVAIARSFHERGFSDTMTSRVERFCSQPNDPSPGARGGEITERQAALVTSQKEAFRGETESSHSLLSG